jgi:hypothetical protein
MKSKTIALGLAAPARSLAAAACGSQAPKAPTSAHSAPALPVLHLSAGDQGVVCAGINALAFAGNSAPFATVPRLRQVVGKASRVKIAIALAAAALALLAGCSGGISAPPAAVRATPTYTMGHGTNGSTSVLAIRQDGASFTGTYDHTPAGQRNVALRYTLTGTIYSGQRFTSTWAVGSVVLIVTGRYTSASIVLDNPGGKLSTTTLLAPK